MPGAHKIKPVLALLAAIAAITITQAAVAGIVITGTRVVYPAAQREVTINIRNSGETPSLVQAWLDAGDPDAKPGDSKVPFVLTPPLFRLDPAKSQSLRLVFTHDPLPEDRETVFWLNVLDIPPRAAPDAARPNQLEMAFKHRMKVFFRPARLAGSAADAPAQLTWKLQSKDGRYTGVEVRNPGAYHVSLTQVTVAVGGHALVAKADMIAPFSSRSFDFPDPSGASGGAATLEYWFVNDYGGSVKAAASAVAR